MKTILPIFLVGILLSWSCKRDKCTVYCNDGYSFDVVGYDTTELDTVVIRAYMPNDSFNRLVYSDTIVKHWDRDFDTLDVWYTSSLAETDTVYNWELIIPSVNRTYRITDVNIDRIKTGEFATDNEYDNCGLVRSHDYCSNVPQSYKIDGRHVQYIPNAGGYNWSFYCLK